jgi:hypothetical protein
VAMGGKKNPKLKCANETCDYERPYDPDDLLDEAESEASTPTAGSATG